MKYALLYTLILGLSNEALTFDGIVKHADGRIWYMNQYEATNYCASTGSRLPTAYEWAGFSTRYGGKVKDYIVEGNGYRGIRSLNPDGTREDFAYNFIDYERPTGDDGRCLFWSSSTETWSSKYAYVFYGLDGNISSFRGGRDYHRYCVQCTK